MTSKKMGIYEAFIHKSRYSRYLWDEGRRESWEETVLRYVNFWKEKGMLNDEEAVEIANAIENLEVMPSASRGSFAIWKSLKRRCTF